MRFGSAWPGANFRLVDNNTDIAPDIHLLALVPDKPGTLELREMSLAISILSTSSGFLHMVGRIRCAIIVSHQVNANDRRSGR